MLSSLWDLYPITFHVCESACNNDPLWADQYKLKWVGQSWTPILGQNSVQTDINDRVKLFAYRIFDPSELPLLIKYERAS
jgi:hypothetical protein